MSDIELLALIRFLLCLIAFPFAIRARYWLLAGVLGLATLLSAATVFGLPRVIGGLVAVPVYALLAAHTLDVTRRRHPPRRS